MLHKSLEQTVAEGLEQTAEYMDRCAAEEGHLVIFDRRGQQAVGRTRCSTAAGRWPAGWRLKCGECEIYPGFVTIEIKDNP